MSRKYLFYIIISIVGIILVSCKSGPPSEIEILKNFYHYDLGLGFREGYLLQNSSPEEIDALSVYYDLGDYCAYNDSGTRVCANRMNSIALSILLEYSDDTSAIAHVEGVLRPIAKGQRISYLFPDHPSRLFSHRVELRLIDERLWKIIKITSIEPIRNTYDVKYIIGENEQIEEVAWGTYLEIPYSEDVYSCEIIVNGETLDKNTGRGACSGFALGEFGVLSITQEE
jgi:hypothetical protein